MLALTVAAEFTPIERQRYESLVKLIESLLMINGRAIDLKESTEMSPNTLIIADKKYRFTNFLSTEGNMPKENTLYLNSVQ